VDDLDEFTMFIVFVVVPVFLLALSFGSIFDTARARRRRRRRAERRMRQEAEAARSRPV
jgi:hypothetical protein